MKNKELILDIICNPQNYLSYKNFIKYSTRTLHSKHGYSAFGEMVVACYPFPLPDTTLVFEIEGTKFHKNLKDIKLYVSPLQLCAYGKTKDEFYDDWYRTHYK